jgi:hypothetical protein
LYRRPWTAKEAVQAFQYFFDRIISLARADHPFHRQVRGKD